MAANTAVCTVCWYKPLPCHNTHDLYYCGNSLSRVFDTGCRIDGTFHWLVHALCTSAPYEILTQSIDPISTKIRSSVHNAAGASEPTRGSQSSRAIDMRRLNRQMKQSRRSLRNQKPSLHYIHSRPDQSMAVAKQP